MPNLTRRSLLAVLTGGAASSVALAVPAIAAISPSDENAFVRVRRLQKELSAALAELASEAVGGPDYVSVVKPEGCTRYARSLIDRDIYEETEQNLHLVAAMRPAVREWRTARAAKADALAAYNRATRSEAPASQLPVTHPARVAWTNADDAANDAQWKVLRLVDVIGGAA